MEEKFLSKDDAFLKYYVEEFRARRKLKLRGECKMCGKCCDGGIRTFYMNPVTMQAELREQSDKQCPHFDTKTKKCTKYFEDRPILCRLFPYTPENLYEGCGYYFEEEK